MTPVRLSGPMLSLIPAPCPVVTLPGYVTAVLTYSTACMSQVLAWLWATVYSMPVWASPRKPWLLLHWGYMELHYVMALLLLCCGQCCSCRIIQERLRYGCCASQERMNSAHSYGLASSSSLLAQALPTLGSVNSRQ